VIGGLRRAPGQFGAWRGGRRARVGETATHRALAALAAGDAVAARTEAARARKLLGDTPLVLLLTAESARLAGDSAAAKAAFAQLSGDKHLGFVGHHGLLRETVAAGDRQAAQAHAAAAESAYPGSPVVKTQRLELAAGSGDFAAALGLTRAPAQVAALATAAAAKAASPKAALDYARQAVKAVPTLAPAVLALAASLTALGKGRAARRALAAGWKAAPHPDIAAAYLAPITTPLERAQAAQDLAAERPGDPDSELLLAETALAADLPGEARRHAQAALAAGSTDGRAENVIAALEGRPAAAVMGGRRWSCTACFVPQPGWSATCPACGRIGTLAWKAPPGSALALPAG